MPSDDPCREDKSDESAAAWLERQTAGTKHDSGKDRWDLLPLEAVRPIVAVLTFGAKKYAPGNWKKVPDPVERYYAAMMRHLAAWRAGEQVDEESGIHHLGHAGCDLVFLLWFELKGKPDGSR